MKKTPRKFVLRSETLRTLPNMDLVRVGGGNDSGANQCLDAAQSGAKQCGTGVDAGVIATSACH